MPLAAIFSLWNVEEIENLYLFLHLIGLLVVTVAAAQGEAVHVPASFLGSTFPEESAVSSQQWAWALSFTCSLFAPSSVKVSMAS